MDEERQSFMDVAVDRDWDNDTIISLLLEFIAEHDLEEALANRAAEVAAREDED